MKVEDVMSRDVLIVSPDLTVPDVARMMSEKEATSALVVEHDKPLGIVTEHDFLARLLALNKEARTTKIREIMSSPVVDIGPEVSIFDAIVIMRKRNFSQLPVMQKGKLAGIVTLDSLLKFVATFFSAHRM